jgi:uncharacterized protein
MPMKNRTFTESYGPWAVVTGASDGIGRELARQLAEAGLHVALVARRQDRLAELAAEIHDRHGVETRIVVADLSDPAQVEATEAAIQGLDVGLLVASAGYGTSGPFVELDPGVEAGMVDVNCRAVVSMAHAHARRLRGRRRSGGIILLSSIVAFQGVPGSATYAASKAFVQSFAEALAIELAPEGIDVVSSAPGPVHSGFAERAGMDVANAARPDEVAAATLRALGRRSRVRPGTRAKMLALALSTAPRPLRTRIMGSIIRGFTVERVPA